MSKLDNLSKFEIKADVTGVLNKTYDDTLQKPLNSSSGIVTTVLDFFHNTVMYPMQKYNIYAENKLQNYATHLQSKAQTIPNQYLVNPRVNILGPTIDGLKYNLDEDYIKEMFTNILISDMDSRKQDKVLPSYIEIVKQLSKEDAKFLSLISKTSDLIPSIQLKIINKDEDGFVIGKKYIILNYCKKSDGTVQYSTKAINDIILDNLLRLRILECDYSNFYCPDAMEQYNSLFNSVKNQYLLNSNQTLDYSKGYISITEFGLNFINICLS